MNDDELNESERAALDGWTPLAPPAGFADRVLAAREVPPVATRSRWPVLLAGTLAAAAAAAILLVTLRDPSQAARGELVDAKTRTTRALGHRAVVVAEPSASLTWRIDDDGDAVIDQREGDVFYRVDRGGPFVVHTPAGDVEVTGTCFRIEIQPMNTTKKLILSGALGAAVATGIVVTVYEGHVIASSRQGSRAEIAAGNRATLSADGLGDVASVAAAAREGDTASAAFDARTATREQLLAHANVQQAEIAKLRSRLAGLETPSGPRGHHDEPAEEGRAWYDPSPERLAEWATECHVRFDEPGLDQWQPSTSLGKNERGLEAGELTQMNAALTEVQQQWKALVRALYIEATGDTAGAETLSTEAMRREIEEKSAPSDNTVRQRIAQERAGQIPAPTDLSRATPFERMFRAYLKLGDQSEQALAKRLGPERAKAIRGDGWGSRSDMSGCPDTGAD
jgi:hypothetical protein